MDIATMSITALATHVVQLVGDAGKATGQKVASRAFEVVGAKVSSWLDQKLGKEKATPIIERIAENPDAKGPAGELHDLLCEHLEANEESVHSLRGLLTELQPEIQQTIEQRGDHNKAANAKGNNITINIS